MEHMPSPEADADIVAPRWRLDPIRFALLIVVPALMWAAAIIVALPHLKEAGLW